MPEPMTPDRASETVQRMVCSDCWEHLIEYYDAKTRMSVVRCATKDCECHGYVSKAFVERRAQENRAEAIEAKAVLREALPWMPKRSEKELLSELGF